MISLANELNFCPIKFLGIGIFATSLWIINLEINLSVGIVYRDESSARVESLKVERDGRECRVRLKRERNIL